MGGLTVEKEVLFRQQTQNSDFISLSLIFLVWAYGTSFFEFRVYIFDMIERLCGWRRR